jgi:hypothetical protein
MAFATGVSCVVLIDAFDASGYLHDANPSQDRAVPECSTFGVGARSYVKGLQGGKFSTSGFFDIAAGGNQSVFDGFFAGSPNQVITCGPTGIAVGAIVRMLSGVQGTHASTIPVDNVVGTSAEWTADGGITAGRSLKVLASISATVNGASVDNAALTSNGGVAHLHVTVNTRDATVVVKVQHSDDDAIWVDLVTFATVGIGATTKERVVVAAGTTVNRYLRAVHTLAAGTGAITSAVAFGRK